MPELLFGFVRTRPSLWATVMILFPSSPFIRRDYLSQLRDAPLTAIFRAHWAMVLAIARVRL